MIALRRTLAALLTVGAAVPAAQVSSEASSLPVVAGLALFGLPLAALLFFVRRLEPQILARSVLWGALVFGTLLACAADTPETEAHAVSLGLVLGCGGALLALGATGLDAPAARAAFVPQAFRGVLVAILVMAVADTCTLLFWGGLGLEGHLHRPATFLAFTLGGGGLMLLAVIGLYGLRVWGFALNVLANVVIAAGAWLVDGLATEIAACLTATAVGQLLVGLPLLRGLAARDERALLSPRLARALGAVVVVGLMATSVVARWHYATAISSASCS